MRADDEGLIVIQNCPLMLPWTNAYCKISEAKVISGLNDAENRFIAYSVKGWSTVPDDDSESTAVTVGGLSLWVVKIPNQIFNVYEIDDFCKTHFITQVCNLNYDLSVEAKMNQITQPTVRSLGFAFFAEGIDDPIAEIKRAWHVESFTSINNGPINSHISESLFLMLNNTIARHETPYDLVRQWFKTHRSSLLEGLTFSKQRFFKLQDE